MKEKHSGLGINTSYFEMLTGEAVERDIIGAIQKTVDDLRARKGPLQILEAGCGSASVLSLPGDNVTGIDLSKQQLERNTLLNERICGDICTYEFEEAIYDILICWNVLEHVDDPKAAMENLTRSLGQSGVMLLALPNRKSLHGFVVRATPHWFHIFVVRHLLGKSWAGKNGRGPFPTTMRKTAEFEEISKLANSLGLEIALALKYEGNQQRRLAKRLTPLRWLLGMLRAIRGDDIAQSAMVFALVKG